MKCPFDKRFFLKKPEDLQTSLVALQFVESFEAREPQIQALGRQKKQMLQINKLCEKHN